MTVKELKDFIEKLPDDMPVFKDILNFADLEGNKWDYIVEPIEKPRTNKRVGKTDIGFAVAQRPCEETKGARKCLIL